MAHGTPRINVCYTCNHCIKVNRFSPNPVCPVCNKETEQTSENDLKKKYYLFEFNTAFSEYTKLIPKT